ncbi:hypothetical protein PN466_24195 [Roseofilum reptotaenium CS-1145]|uniref:Uncharacterized protein n=1 Tax=Roseofilum reptotaenium AO1-A TaxID=1925591 RepID=A0A1L9QQ68_9CYAN|nr:hypothetical protein [Roseofilum reptotaenium]MDB9520051.1 hypothetical protein [Roseofilum reptotaenium CS-1145]OJJ24838.1 hypothetical protein BI308_14840 [Roseofilum reptotaenium AO1-A]
MDLDAQIQTLIDQAPQDGHTPQIIAAIAPALKRLAQELQHSQYYILQSVSGEWVFTTLRNNEQPKLTKKVIYAFPTLKDAAQSPSAKEDPNLMAVEIAITSLLFQMVTLPIDSLVFFETPGNLQAGVEVFAEDVKNLIQSYLAQLSSGAAPPISNIPPNIA